MNSHTPKNYPDDVSERTHEAPWNKTRDRDDIEDEIDALYILQDAANKMSNHINECIDGSLFDVFANYELTGPLDMLETMQQIINDRLQDLKKL